MVYEMRRHVWRAGQQRRGKTGWGAALMHTLPTAPSPTTTHLMVCIAGGAAAEETRADGLRGRRRWRGGGGGGGGGEVDAEAEAEGSGGGGGDERSSQHAASRPAARQTDGRGTATVTLAPCTTPLCLT